MRSSLSAVLRGGLLDDVEQSAGHEQRGRSYKQKRSERTADASGRAARAKRGSTRHLICDGRGVPLAVRLTGANRNDSQEPLALVDAIPLLHGSGAALTASRSPVPSPNR